MAVKCTDQEYVVDETKVLTTPMKTTRVLSGLFCVIMVA